VELSRQASGERPGLLALAGAALIVAGVFFVSGGLQGLGPGHAGRAVGYGLAAGGLIAGYTVWDKVSVSTRLLPPVLVDYCSNLGRTVLLTPLSYILVLTAGVFTPVSHVAPAREVSVLIAVAMGTGLLSEGQAVAGRRGHRDRHCPPGAKLIGCPAAVGTERAGPAMTSCPSCRGAPRRLKRRGIRKRWKAGRDEEGSSGCAADARRHPAVQGQGTDQ
jgi:hypothetical protein